MKKLFLTGAVIAAASLSGCVTMQGEHAVVNGKCITCINNPMTGKAINYNPETQQTSPSQQSSRGNRELAADGCRKPDGMYDQTHHFRDDRWCDDITIPGAAWSQEYSYSESVPVSVDMAYIRAKRLLKFRDAETKPNGNGFFAHQATIDRIPGTYYGIQADTGGPMHYETFLARYDLQLEKIANNQTKVRVTYRVYSKDMEPAEFQTVLLAKIKGN